MMRIRRAKKKTAPRRAKRLYTVDGISYKSNSIAEQHQEWKNDSLVSCFSLPEASEDKKTKYGAKKVMVNDKVFDSIMEARFYVYLLHLVDKKELKSFECQVSFELQEKYRDKFTGKIVRPINYIADFLLESLDGRKAAIDVKGIETDVFKLKKKIFGIKYPNIVLECVRWSAAHNDWMDLEDLKKETRERKKKQIASA